MPTVIPALVPRSPLFRSPTASPAPTAHGPSPTAYPWRSDDLLVARPAARPHVPAARAQARGTFALGGSDPYLTSRNVVDTGSLPARGALLARSMGYRDLALDPYVSRGTRHDAEGSPGTMTPAFAVDVARADTPDVSRATVLAMLSTRRVMLRQLAVTPMPVHWSRVEPICRGSRGRQPVQTRGFTRNIDSGLVTSFADVKQGTRHVRE